MMKNPNGLLRHNPYDCPTTQTLIGDSIML